MFLSVVEGTLLVVTPNPNPTISFKFGNAWEKKIHVNMSFYTAAVIVEINKIFF